MVPLDGGGNDDVVERACTLVHEARHAGARPHNAQFPAGSSEEVSRVIQGLVAGIGFLGTGAILNGSRDGEVRGLTTAAGIWLTAAVGVLTVSSKLWISLHMYVNPPRT